MGRGIKIATVNVVRDNCYIHSVQIKRLRLLWPRPKQSSLPNWFSVTRIFHFCISRALPGFKACVNFSDILYYFIIVSSYLHLTVCCMYTVFTIAVLDSENTTVWMRETYVSQQQTPYLVFTVQSPSHLAARR